MDGLRQLLGLLKLLWLLKRLVRMVGRRNMVVADEVGLGLPVELHGIRGLKLLVLVMWLQLWLLRARHRRSVHVMKRGHL